MFRNHFLSFGIVVIVMVLDLWTKGFWFAHERWIALGPLLTTVQHRNHGLIFNVPAPIWLILGVSAIVFILVLVFFYRKIAQWPIALALGLLLGGALGNGYDRIVFGFVRDWILLFERSAFNIADMAIAAGLIILLLSQKPELVDEPV
jgi:signal peptidase II